MSNKDDWAELHPIATLGDEWTPDMDPDYDRRTDTGGDWEGLKDDVIHDIQLEEERDRADDAKMRRENDSDDNDD
jgi:hypothetical protein